VFAILPPFGLAPEERKNLFVFMGLTLYQLRTSSSYADVLWVPDLHLYSNSFHTISDQNLNRDTSLSRFTCLGSPIELSGARYSSKDKHAHPSLQCVGVRTKVSDEVIRQGII